MKIEKTNNSKEYLKFLESKTIRSASTKFPNIAFNNRLLVGEDSRALRPYFGFSSKVIAVFFFLFFSMLSLDLASKWWIEANLVHKEKPSTVAENKGSRVYLNPENDFLFVEHIVIAEPFLKISYTRNFNIGFSALKSLEEAVGLQMIFIIVLALQTFVMILLSVLFVTHFPNCYIAFAFILAGGAGNIIDRSMRGYVVDFVELRIPWGNISLFDPWPIFNVADVSVTIGALLLSIYFFSGKIDTDL